VTELTPAQLKAFQDAVQPVYKQFEDRIGKQLIEELRAEIQKASK
jgi:TRAP-type C4-dicarboxylate transport system substrate-binding protein